MHWAIWSFELSAVRNDWHFCETEVGIKGLAGEPVAAGAAFEAVCGGVSLEPKQTDACVPRSVDRGVGSREGEGARAEGTD